MKSGRFAQAVRRLGLAVVLAVQAAASLALDPPHDQSRNFQCVTCHALHNSPGGTLNRVAGNANVCLACHVPTGQAAARSFATATDPALPPEPRVSGWTAGSGTSHRWDSGPSGHVRPGGGNSSSGRVASSGTFTGRIEEVYTITIAAAGQVGAATFTWTSLRDGSGAATLTAASAPIGSKGLSIHFANGTGSPSFVAGDTFILRVRTDLRLPTLADLFEKPLAQRVMLEELPNRTTLGGPKVVCSTCHDQHSQKNAPFDPAAPPYFGPGTGWTSTGIGRHFQRQPNDTNQMCKICHSARDVTTSAGGSHPVGIAITADSRFKSPALPVRLDSGNQIQCMSCHAPHFQTSGGANGGAGDGFLLRANLGTLCLACHTSTGGGDPTPFADTTGGSHFNASTGALWGGSKDLAGGTEFPPHTADKRGMCINCHWPHGWPDRATPASDYPKLWVERYDTDRTGKSDGANGEKLCFACHTNSVATANGTRPLTPATSNVEAEFSKGSALATATGDVFRHPVNDTEQTPLPAGRAVECVDCHNPHKAGAVDRHAGVSGIDLNNATVSDRPLFQFELCFKCHGSTFNSGRPNTTDKRLDFQPTNNAYHPVVQPGRNKSTNLANQLSGAGLDPNATIRCTDCHNSNAYSGTTGRVIEVTATGPVGPHGSTNAPILRASFSLDYTGQSWAAANANLCFRCHDAAQLFGSSTGFTDQGSIGGYRRGNLHNYHLTTKSATSSCMSCHYDIHSNRSATNTEYRWLNNGTLVYAGTSPPAGLKTKLVNFAPDVTGNGNGGAPTSARPIWEIDVGTRMRKCSINCHGKNMDYDKAWYQPTVGSDDASHTYRVTTTSVTSGTNPSTTAQSVTFTATIAGTGINPTGSVLFRAGPQTLCAASAISGTGPFVASCTASAGTFAKGVHGVVATYSGDADDGASTSAILRQNVN